MCLGLRQVVVVGLSFVDRVAHGEAVATLGATTSQNLAAIGSLHALTKAVLVGLLAVGGLECSFHLALYLIVIFFVAQNAVAKVQLFSELTKYFCFSPKKCKLSANTECKHKLTNASKCEL